MEYRIGEKLKDWTTLKIGGPAARFYEPQSIEDIQEILRENQDSDQRLMVLGNGSNVLFEDEGYDGWIIHLGEEFSGLRELGNGAVRVLAGTENGDLADYLARHGLAGFEFASGIPGTVGGAVIMNAGAYDGQYEDVLLRVGYLDENGELHEVEAADLDLGYRHSWFTDHFGVVVYADLQFKSEDPAKVRAKIDELHEKRYSKQPMDKASAGSTFKRPKTGYASAMISECGLQGLRVGDAMVSTKHAGFLINDGEASCTDFLELVRQVQARVKEEKGADLELEVHFIPAKKK
ncbi:UDP-N-acetylmuramate dehydrogenase [Allobaculum mucilyticum]|uniref:UDP-N-acetylmuramate dehydrogenase n=1 Tax=Allobaculum mucilyticum TaxID=2834459 RepID=UPI001E3FA8DC|nr:UDP-N-acetylmuramate dehydrogenase [Allobaculum mucilyticum]UNT95509.1 UDP-N-acetylmuramate dehydrogenase [Allobaculum mucilyticum]